MNVIFDALTRAIFKNLDNQILLILYNKLTIVSVHPACICFTNVLYNVKQHNSCIMLHCILDFVICLSGIVFSI